MIDDSDLFSLIFFFAFCQGKGQKVSNRYKKMLEVCGCELVRIKEEGMEGGKETDGRMT